LFDRERLIVDAEFTATGCGIEKTLGLYKDAVVLIDDFKPGVTPQQQKEADQKLDQLVRYYGNRVGKKRMNDYQNDADKKYFPINGVCILTMEIVTGVTSSLSRMFLTDIGFDDVNNANLAFYQNNRWVLPTHMYDFITWITNHFDDAVKFIFWKVPSYRSAKKFVYPRFCEMYATMLTTAELICKYALERAFWKESECNAFMQTAESVVVNEILQMSRRVKSQDKATTVILALSEALIASRLTPVVLSAETASKRYECYVNEETLFIQTRLLKQIVNEYCKVYGLTCSIVNEEEVIGLLNRRQVLDVLEKDGSRICSRKLPIQHGNSLRYLYLKRTKFDELCKE